jgi:hypothetical protein
VTLEQVFCQYFGFFSQFVFHRLLQTHQLSYGTDTIDQLVADVPSGLSLTPPQEIKKRLNPESNFEVFSFGQPEFYRVSVSCVPLKRDSIQYTCSRRTSTKTLLNFRSVVAPQWPETDIIQVAPVSYLTYAVVTIPGDKACGAWSWLRTFIKIVGLRMRGGIRVSSLSHTYPWLGALSIWGKAETCEMT